MNEVLCPRCGSLIPTDYRYCGFCGAPVSSATTKRERHWRSRAIRILERLRPERIDRHLAWLLSGDADSRSDRGSFRFERAFRFADTSKAT